MNFDDPETYRLLIGVCRGYGVDPSVPIESEFFFRNLLREYAGSGDQEDFSAWLEKQVAAQFIALGERPRWIQSSEWPIVDGEPSIFVGQLDVSLQDNEAASKVFHDDTSFYIFLAKKRPPVVVMQQF